jgi:hypothetical protein
MYKKQCVLLIFLLICLSSVAQSPELQHFNQKRLQITKIGMLTLGGWAIGNIGTAAFSLSSASGSNKHFHQMNLYWNTVNLAIAGFGYYGAYNSDQLTYNLFSSLKEHYGMEKILLLNAGLDVAYITGGFYLTERAKNNQRKEDLLKGFGQSVVMQGGFLLLFDTAMYFVHHANIGVLKTILSSMSFHGNSLYLTFQF